MAISKTRSARIGPMRATSRRQVSESVAERHLDDARRPKIFFTQRSSDACSWPRNQRTEVGEREHVLRHALYGMPAREDIENVQPVLQVVALGEWEILEKRHIPSAVHWRPQDVAPSVPKRSQRRRSKRGFIEPVGQSLRSSMRILSGCQIGPQAVTERITREVSLLAAATTKDAKRHAAGKSNDAARLPVA